MTTLEKIRDEIEKIAPLDYPCDKRTPEHIRDMALEIIDKYAEQEPTDENLHREREQAYMQGYEDASKKYRQEPCDYAIDRQAVLDMCKKEIDHINKNWQNYHSPSEAKSGFAYIATNIYALPPVTPQQKIGQWIAYEVQLPDRTILNYRCSVCGRKLIGYNTETLSEAPYCHCGAKMIEPQERSGKE